MTTRGFVSDESWRCWYLSAWQDVGVGLYPRYYLAQNDPVRKHIHLQGEEDESIKQKNTHERHGRDYICGLYSTCVIVLDRIIAALVTGFTDFHLTKLKSNYY